MAVDNLTVGQKVCLLLALPILPLFGWFLGAKFEASGPTPPLWRNDLGATITFKCGSTIDVRRGEGTDSEMLARLARLGIPAAETFQLSQAIETMCRDEAQRRLTVGGRVAAGAGLFLAIGFFLFAEPSTRPRADE